MRCLLVIFACLFMWGGFSPGVSGQASNEVVWRTMTSKDEFSIAMPDGSTGYSEDNDYFMGPARISVTKRNFVYRSINGVVFVVEVYEGDTKGIKAELAKRLMAGSVPYALTKEQLIENVPISVYQKREEKLFSEQQFYTFKKRLYVAQVFASDANNPLIGQFFGSVAISTGGKTLMPNVSPGQDPTGAAVPPSIVVNEVAAAAGIFEGKPDRNPVFLYKPRPYYPSDARSRGVTGTVKLKVLFSAAGKVEKVELVSGDRALFESAKTAAGMILFVPAEKDGKPVSIWRPVEYSFSVY